MTGLVATVLPVALGGALLAGFSYPGGARSMPRRRGAPRGARWAGRRDLRPLLVGPDPPTPAGRLLLGEVPGTWRPSGVAAEPAFPPA